MITCFLTSHHKKHAPGLCFGVVIYWYILPQSFRITYCFNLHESPPKHNTTTTKQTQHNHVYILWDALCMRVHRRCIFDWLTRQMIHSVIWRCIFCWNEVVSVTTFVSYTWRLWWEKQGMHKRCNHIPKKVWDVIIHPYHKYQLLTPMSTHVYCNIRVCVICEHKMSINRNRCSTSLICTYILPEYFIRFMGWHHMWTLQTEIL